MKATFALLLSLSVPLVADQEPIDEIVFGSCFKQNRPAATLETIAASPPDVFIWMGDNIYGDSEDMSVLEAKYEQVLSLPAYQKIQSASKVIGTWDDHDYGANDAGKNFPKKKESQQLLLDFLGEPESSPRREQDGVYGFHDFGPKEKQVRIILLDTRFHRDDIGSDGTLLGEEQWTWFENALRNSPAQVNIVVSSIQVLPSDHRFEKWSNFPSETKRLMTLLAGKDVPPVLLLSGDRHLAEISLDSASSGYPLYEITSSSLNQGIRNPREKNSRRLGENYGRANFGRLHLDWSREEPIVTATVCDEKGDPKRAVSFQLKR